MTRKRKSTQFSKVLNFIYYQHLLHETYSVVRNDRFRPLKRPLSLSGNQEPDDDLYLARLLNTFHGRFNLLTLNIPVKEKLFNEEIRDDLFEQFYRQEQNYSADQNEGSNYQRLFAINYVETVVFNKDGYDFSFSLSFFRSCIVISNPDNLTRLLLGLLNVLSLYLDLNVLDFHSFFCLIRPAFISVFNLLLKLKKFLGLSIRGSLEECFLEF